MPVPDDAGVGKAYGHLFAAKHHGVLSTEKAHRLVDLPPARDFTTGHRETYEWFCASPLADVGSTIADPLWGAGFDLALEAEVAASLRAGR